MPDDLPSFNALHGGTAMIYKASAFAAGAHAAVGQKRKYTGFDYIYHPRAVARLVIEVTNDQDIIAAALLHDVVEDTQVTLDQIRWEFNTRIAELVGWVTDVSRPADGNRAARKAIDREHLAKAPAEAQTIKLADLIDNTSSIVAHDPEFAKVYMREKRDLLGVLTKGDKRLWDRAMAIIEHYEASVV